MTLQEFRAWFEGFTENLDGPPNTKQWKRIQARVKDIDGQTVIERILLDDLRPRLVPAPEPVTPLVPYMQDVWCTTSGGSTIGVPGLTQSDYAGLNLRNIGRVDAQELTAGE